MQAALDDLKAAVDAGVNSHELKSLRPLRKAAFLCSAACCDGRSDDAFQACLQSCATTAERAEETLVQELGGLQGRLQRALAVCQDKAQDVVRDGGREEKAQKGLEACVSDAAASAKKELPKLFSRLKA